MFDEFHKTLTVQIKTQSSFPRDLLPGFLKTGLTWTLWLPIMRPSTCKYFHYLIIKRGLNFYCYFFFCNPFPFSRQNPYFSTYSLKIISVMKYYGLEEPDYQEVNHNFWYKLPLYLEYVSFVQKRHKQSKQPTGNAASGASGSNGN